MSALVSPMCLPWCHLCVCPGVTYVSALVSPMCLPWCHLCVCPGVTYVSALVSPMCLPWVTYVSALVSQRTPLDWNAAENYQGRHAGLPLLRGSRLRGNDGLTPHLICETCPTAFFSLPVTACNVTLLHSISTPVKNIQLRNEESSYDKHSPSYSSQLYRRAVG